MLIILSAHRDGGPNDGEDNNYDYDDDYYGYEDEDESYYDNYPDNANGKQH